MNAPIKSPTRTATGQGQYKNSPLHCNALPPSFEEIQSALYAIPSDNRETWWKIGMAIKSELEEGGFDLWNDWSKQAGNYKEDDTKAVWKSIKPNGKTTIKTLFQMANATGWRWTGERHEPSQAEREAWAKAKAEREAKAKAAEAEEKAKHEAAAIKANAIYDAAGGNPAEHPYALKKAVDLGPLVRRGAWSQRGWTDALLVPLCDQDGRIWSLQAINADGSKDFLSGGRKSGLFHPLGEMRGASKVFIAEGMANAAAVYSVAGNGYPCVAAMDAGNLLPVAKVIRGMLPSAELIILADNDIYPDSKLNTGLDAATKAAKAVGGLVAVPELDGRKCDFWDLWRERGADAVMEALGQASKPQTVKNNSGIVNSDVTDVTGVTPNDGAGFSCNVKNSGDVTDVTSSFPKDEERPCYRVFDDWLELPNGSKMKPGVWYFGMKSGADDAQPKPIQEWICSPLRIVAVTSDSQHNNFGRLLRFQNTLGRWRDWAMPMELLKGSGDELRGVLLSMGVELDPRNGRNLLPSYLQAFPPKERIHCAQQTGWFGNCFVLPDSVIGPDADKVIFQSGESGHDEHTQAGTLEGWQSEVSARARGNKWLRLALSGAFAGPMLGKVNAESGGIHFVGDSSSGKTTLLEAGCSVWGGANYRRSWRATANGMEGAAALFNDCLLAVDEISECEPREIGQIVYALGNGRGKQRASRYGSARGVARWRCFILSSGERTIATSMEEGGYKAKAGQGVRLLDLHAAGQFGCFDDLHRMPSGAAFSDAIKRAAVTHHGHAGRLFLEKLTRDGRDFAGYLEQTKALPGFRCEGTEGQDKRAAARFALLGLAGELATEYGVTGWQEGEAIQAAAECFKAWLAKRGRGNDERRQILEQVASFIDRHGDGRFSSAIETGGNPPIVRDRAGWWKDTEAERVYLFNADGMREALKGFDFNRALDVLVNAEALPKPGKNGEKAKPERAGGRVSKLYAITQNKLRGDDES